MIDVVLKRNREMIGLLSEILTDYEEFDGHITPSTYRKLKHFFDEDIPEEIEEKLQRMETL